MTPPTEGRVRGRAEVLTVMACEFGQGSPGRVFISFSAFPHLLLSDYGPRYKFF